ncbi:isochorismatase family cysteine hydrolase [Marinobacter sp. F3R08]|uniref:cysteine hydrolase family protein n=1 Tax=Marinobacter sp. F3R08 TaxID=2841559 RepID=UPI001C089444|nr:cysteine hydrolase [Marinobacter sp. F3R08]
MTTPHPVTVPDAQPYAWPCIAPVAPHRLALVIIDMQKDFCAPGGYIDSQGVDLTPARATIEPIQRVLAAFRALPGALVIHTREGHRPQLADLPVNKQWRSEQVCPGIGNAGPLGRILVRGEPGWEIIPELAPTPDEIVIDKPGKGAFYATDLDHVLRLQGITHLVFAGLTTDVCVHTTVRDANDRGLETLILRDCTAATETRHRDAIFSMTEMQGGMFGATATSEQLLTALALSNTLPE